MTPEEIEVAVGELEDRVERLRAMYEQYFMGIEKIEPLILRKDVDRRLWILRREQIRNTAQRFKLQTVVQRYNTFQQYWMRITREIENGTYHRDVVRAAERFGEAAASTALGRRRQKMIERGLAKKAERDDARAQRIAQEAAEEAIRRGDPPPQPSVQAPSAAASAAAAAPPSAAVPSKRPSMIPAPLVAKPVRPPQDPAAFKPLELDMDDDFGLGSPAPASKPTPAAAKPTAPVSRPSPSAGASSEAPTMPMARVTEAPTLVRAPNPLAADEAPTLVRPNPPPSQQARPPAARPPTAPPPSNVRPVAPAPPPPAPAPTPARPQPVVRRNPFADPAPASAPKPAAAAASPDLSDARIRQIYSQYVEAKRQCKESTAAVTLEGLAKSLRDSVPKLREKHKARSVDFEVVVKDGRTVLKPVVKG